MDCIQAQQVISAALDREPVDVYQLEEAKRHCRMCAECGVFVRAQLVASQVQLPEPPPDLADRVISQIRAEAAEKESARIAAEEAEAAKVAEAERLASIPSPPPATLAPKPRATYQLPRVWVSAALAAAMLIALIGTGVVVIFGMKQMGGSASSAAKTDIYRPAGASTQAPRIAADLSGSGTPAASAPVAAPSTGGQSVTVNGTVFRLVGPAKVDTSTGTLVGTSMTSLGTGNALVTRQVWAGPNADTIYIADDKGQMYAFTRVTRSYAGLTFVLTSAELQSFNQWPMLPTQIPQPTAPDGSPTFTYDGSDASGVRVYRLTNSSATEGIAIAPNTSTSDPAGGNPNWTWWAILR